MSCMFVPNLEAIGDVTLVLGPENRPQVYRKKQRCSRGHKARGQGRGHKKNPRPRTRIGMLEAKAKDQGHKWKCFPKKKGLKKFFFGRSPKKKSLEKHFSADLQNFNHSKK